MLRHPPPLRFSQIYWSDLKSDLVDLPEPAAIVEVAAQLTLQAVQVVVEASALAEREAIAGGAQLRFQSRDLVVAVLQFCGFALVQTAIGNALLNAIVDRSLAAIDVAGKRIEERVAAAEAEAVSRGAVCVRVVEVRVESVVEAGIETVVVAGLKTTMISAHIAVICVGRNGAKGGGANECQKSGY